jgi:tRNA threonylcarbamoyladenosine biosynthesis protein TsaE
LQRDYDDGRLPLHHLDVYRLERLQDVIDLGFEETIDDGSVTCIEWGNAVTQLFPQAWLEVDLSADDVTEARRVLVTGHGLRWTEGADQLARALTPWMESAR